MLWKIQSPAGRLRMRWLRWKVKADPFPWSATIALHSKPFSFSPDADLSPPLRVRISEVKDTSFTLTWRSKTESITGHLIQATPIGGSHATLSRIFPGDVNTYTLTGERTIWFGLLNVIWKALLPVFTVVLSSFSTPQDLQPGTTYSVSLYTMNGNIKSEPYTLILKTGEWNAP